MSEENKTKKIYECIGLLSSMVSCGEDHTSRSREVIADAQSAIDSLENEIGELLADRNLEKRMRKDAEDLRENVLAKNTALERENFAQSDLIKDLESSNEQLYDKTVQLRAEVERLKNV